MAPQVPTLTTSNGTPIPVFGLGTWKSTPGEVTQTVKDAIDLGYRHIDGARCYENEAEVGAAINSKIAEGVVKREDLFLTSKLWNTFHSPDLVLPAVKKTLADLGTDYLDLYLIHWPMGFQEGGGLFPTDDKGEVLFSDVDFVDTWKAMEEVQKLGLAKNIGLSNFNHEQIERILAVATIPVTVNQVECHPHLNQAKLIDYCKSKNIILTAYSPLGSPDRPWARPNDPKLLEDPKIVEVAKKYGKSPAQVVIRWQIQRGVVVIPKTVKKERLIENLNVFDFELSAEDVKLVDSFDCNDRLLLCADLNRHPHYPFHIEY